ncbi:response regulator [Leptospira idonii]|uniref:DNA-binding response regulator n=1 Tax=Leptospira idonii TaxID=1193500 RepID=A0A4R9M6R2_9LEPT|nr:response regulator transcription factor [Leptospira idonii]TGN20358.1 DNA-binding response regulator [Leptospira idonii]
MTLGSKIQVFVIDDHPMIRKGLQSEIENDLTLKFIGSASSIKDALPIIGFKAVDVLVVDISLKDENGLLEFTNIRKKQPNLKIIFFTIHRDWEYLQKAAMLGADGYLLKSDSADRILSQLYS